MRLHKIWHRRIYSPENLKILNEECPSCEKDHVHRCWLIHEKDGKTFQRCAKRSRYGMLVYIYQPSIKHHKTAVTIRPTEREVLTFLQQTYDGIDDYDTLEDLRQDLYDECNSDDEDVSDAASELLEEIDRLLEPYEQNRFFSLRILHEGTRDRHGRRTWVCRCDCGNEITVLEQNLQSSNTKSCGCRKRRIK